MSLLFHMAHPAAELPHLTRVSVLLGHPVVLTPKREAQKMYFEAATGMSFMFAKHRPQGGDSALTTRRCCRRLYSTEVGTKHCPSRGYLQQRNSFL